VGPPGSDKTMLAERLPTILPQLTVEEALESAAVRSIAKPDGLAALDRLAPFQAPHHSSSMVAMVGGGVGIPKPGVISLAHNGVLFLDEAPEFSSQTLESLRQPLESGKVVINRAAGSAWFPARFQLALAANPCPCGNFTSRGSKCTCTASQRTKYLTKLSGPLLDRIDVRLEVRQASPAAIATARLQPGPTSEQLRQRVALAREAARLRLQATPWRANAEVSGAYLRKHLRPDRKATERLDAALTRGLISMRGYDRCLRLAWTSADLAGRASVSAEDVLRALSLRGHQEGETRAA
jgi:magnesium chelatase family protein